MTGATSTLSAVQERSAFFTVRYSSPVTPSTTVPSQRTITLEEVSHHDSIVDCWIVIYDRVYDVTNFMEEHPGGSEVLLENSGRDATCAFRGTGHSAAALKSLSRFMIGELPVEERIFRRNGGINLSDIPS